MNNSKLIIGVILALVIGAGAGYYFGNANGEKAGIASGRQQILDEQKKEQEEALRAAQEAANPFSDVTDKANPFKDVYKNPFAQ
jgi:predicted RNase H-related nuclease YkuK (DUF458 family)